MKKTLTAGLALLALSLTACGGAAETAASTPAPTVTVTSEPEVVEVEVTPAECIEALDLAGEAVMIMGQVQKQTSPAIMAAFQQDAATMESITAEIQRLNEELTAITPGLGVASTACRDAAG